jgi:hypothetical protein
MCKRLVAQSVPTIDIFSTALHGKKYQQHMYRFLRLLATIIMRKVFNICRAAVFCAANEQLVRMQMSSVWFGQT